MPRDDKVKYEEVPPVTQAAIDIIERDLRSPWYWLVMEGEVTMEDHLCGPDCSLHEGEK
jgi:hypothetical protein